MLKHLSSKMKTVVTISLAILVALSLTSVLSSAQGNYAGGNEHIYYDSDQPGYTITTDTPAFWINGDPAFTDEPNGINTGDIYILDRGESPGSPEGA